MELVLAIDLMNGQVVHGKKGNRSTYRPFVHSSYSFKSPIEFVASIEPRFLYIADLDRIQERVGFEG
jgi:phosphoribosylformimino-5-aminoimidazole carboxamide ribotide isomerase